VILGGRGLFNMSEVPLYASCGAGAGGGECTRDIEAVLSFPG